MALSPGPLGRDVNVFSGVFSSLDVNPEGRFWFSGPFCFYDGIRPPSAGFLHTGWPSLAGPGLQAGGKGPGARVIPCSCKELPQPVERVNGTTDRACVYVKPNACPGGEHLCCF